MGNLSIRFIILMISAIMHTSYGQLTSVQIRQIDSVFADWKKDSPGGVACVVIGDKVVYKNAFGLADTRKNIPNAIHMKYDLASNAKQFTAMCIALLEEQGKLSPDDDIRKYYPGLKISDTIRIRNLLDHTSGLRDAAVLAVLAGKMNLKGGVRRRYNTKAYYLECMMRETDLNYPVGEELAYNNFNYVLLGDIVEKVSGKSLPAFSDSAIFRPLGMTNTIWRDKRRLTISEEAGGYLDTGKKFKKRVGIGGIVGDHNLLSTVDDLVKWQRNFTRNTLGNGDPDLTRKVSTSSRLNSGEATQYGYGLWIGKYRDLTEIGHGGDDGRHTSTLKRFPEQDLNIIILANSSRFDQTQRMAYDIVDVLHPLAVPNPALQETYAFVTLPEDELKAYAGTYTFVDKRGIAQLAKVSFEDGALYASRHYYAKGVRLSAVDAQYFIGKNREGELVHIRFSRDSGRLMLTENFRDYPTRKYFRKEKALVSFKDYPGTYENASTGAKIKVKNKGDEISARKSILRIPLIPFGPDQFYGPANDVLFIFSRDELGTVTGFKANAHDFRNFYFKRKK